VVPQRRVVLANSILLLHPFTATSDFITSSPAAFLSRVTFTSPAADASPITVVILVVVPAEIERTGFVELHALLM
jgi:hypothetical protein